MKTGAETSGFASGAGSRATSGKGEYITSLKYQIPSDEEHQPGA